MQEVYRNESGPDYFGYWKHRFLSSLSEDSHLEPFEASCIVEDAKVKRLNRSDKSVSLGCILPFFVGATSGGLSKAKKEKANLILCQSIGVLSEETDRIFDDVIATFQAEAALRERELLNDHSSASDEDLSTPFRNRKRKGCHKHCQNHKSPSFSKVHDAVNDFQGNGDHEAVAEYSKKIYTTLEKLEEDLDDFLDVITSKCRPMTHAEKQQLGQRIQELPSQALVRVVEILHPRNSSSGGFPVDEVHIDIEKQGNVTLWRLYYYTEAVMRANRA